MTVSLAVLGMVRRATVHPQVKARLEASQAANEAASAGETLRLKDPRNGGDSDLSLSQKMESCCT